METSFTQIPNKVLESIMRSKFTGTEKDIILAVCRLTYGWHKKADKIGAGQLSNYTGFPRSYIFELLKNLTEKNVIIKIKGKNYQPNTLRINEKIKEWKIEIRGDQLELITNMYENTTPDQSSTDKTSQLQPTHQINKESKKRIEAIKKEIKEKLRIR